MEVRSHHLAWIVGAAIFGVAACGDGSGEKPASPSGRTGGTPGGRDGGAEPAECVGPTWFGTIEEPKRARLIEQVCGDALLGSAPSARLHGDAGSSCKGMFAVRSDEEISAILMAVDEG